LDAIVALHKPELIFVTEFAPKHTSTPVQESELQVEGYDLCTNIDCYKRGVLIYVSKKLCMNPVDMKKWALFEENVWAEIKLKGRDKLLIGCIYRSPNSDTTNNEKLMAGLKKICESKQYTHLLICGDFNLPDIDWKTETAKTSVNHVAFKFAECVKDCFLTQHVQDPTHQRGNQKANLLDLIMTNEEGMVSNLVHGAPIGASHHHSLSFEFNCYTRQGGKGAKTFRYNRGNYEDLRKMMSDVEWKEILEEKSCTEAWEVFHNRMLEGMTKCIPKGWNKSKKPGRTLWMNEKAMAKVKKKSEAYKRYLETKEGEDYNRYARARNQARWACRKSKRDFEVRIAHESKKNPKAFYNYANSKMKVKAGIADLDTGTSKATTDKQKAEVLNTFFTSVFTREDVENVPELESQENIHPLSELQVTKEKVEEKLRKLNPTKSSGPDELHPRVLQELSSVLSEPLSIIMQKSIDEEVLPQAWKDAHVTPIFKKGKKNQASNYRPVSLTSVVCKVLESIVRDQVMDHMEKYKLITEHQHGFVPGRSCSTQLLACLDIWTEILDRGSCLDSIYLDFSKAFDSVPHIRLCKKLENFGIQGKLLNWFRDFLRNRRQRVVVNGEKSEWDAVLSGVPQGSVIGPTLFIIFINDMPEVVTNLIKLFADDAKLFSEVMNEDQWKRMAEDLKELQKWADKWQLIFNAKKCKVMHLGGNNKKYDYIMDNIRLEEVDVEKDLGVWIDDQLKLSTHIENQVKKANKIIGLIRRSFTHLDKDGLCTLYKSLVRSHLEYANVVTYPQYEKDAKLLENVQRRATRLVPSLRELDYEDRLRELELPSLLYRRNRGDMIEAYKYLHGMYDVNPNPLHRDKNQITRGHSLKLEKRRASKTTRQQFFPFRIVNTWNSLPENIVSAPTINSFKARLDKLWGNKLYETPKLC
jgi:hypothetical protein